MFLFVIWTVKGFNSPLYRSYKTCTCLLYGESFCNIILSIHCCLFSLKFEVLLSFDYSLFTVFRFKGSIFVTYTEPGLQRLAYS